MILAFGPEITQGFDEFLHALVETGAKFLESGFLAGRAAEGIAFSGDLKFCLGHDIHLLRAISMPGFEPLP